MTFFLWQIICHYTLRHFAHNCGKEITNFSHRNLVRKITKITPLKRVFDSILIVSIDYRERLKVLLLMDEWIRDLHRFLASFIVSVNSGKVSDKASERRLKKKTGKRRKITFSFARRYLENRESYRDKRESILKKKVPRFQWSFTRR